MLKIYPLKYVFRRYIYSLLILLTFFSFSNQSYGWNFDPTLEGHLDIDSTLIESDKIIRFKIIGHRKTGSNDFLHELKLKVNNTLVFKMLHYYPIQSGYATTSFEYLNDDNSLNTNVNGNEFYYKDFGGYTSSIQKDVSPNPSYNNNPEGYFTIDIHIKDEELFLDNYNFSWEIDYRDQDNSATQGGGYAHHEGAVNCEGWSSLSPLPTITTSSDICGQIELNWPEEDDDLFYKVKSRKIGASTWTTSTITAIENYTDSFSNSVSKPSNEKEYKVVFGWGPDMKQSTQSEILTGAIPELINPPTNFEADENNCIGNIRLSWNSSGDESEKYLIRIKSGNVWYNDTIDGSLDSYTIDSSIGFSIQPNTMYDVSIASFNKCLIRGVHEIIQAKWIDNPELPTQFTASESSLIGENKVHLTWKDNAINESEYIIKKTVNEDNISYINLGSNTESYTDADSYKCNDYKYELFVKNFCSEEEYGISDNTPIEKSLGSNLSNTFVTDSNLNISKGYFSNYIELQWNVENNENVIETYKIYRKLLGSGESFVQINAVSASSNVYIDNTSDAGVLYEYLIIGEAECGSIISYTDSIKGTGFRSPTAIVNGQVNYSGGIAVEGVKLSFESTNNTGKSILLGGASGLKAYFNLDLPINSSIDSQELFFETWLRPNNDETFSIFEKVNVFKFRYANQHLELVNFDNNDTTAVSYTMDQNEWQHIGIKLANDSLGFFIDGQLIGRVDYNNNFDYNSPDLFTIGKNFKGYLDEIRIWNQSPSDSLISRDHSRFIAGNREGLVSYLQCNENDGKHVYDISHVGTNYNKNNAFFNNELIIRSNEQPTADQLSHVVYTNELGSYTIVIPFQGTGQNFTVTPSFKTHAFSPATKALFIGDGATVNNGIDFEDISSFPVTGSVFYYGSNCPSAKNNIYIDGQAAIQVNGERIETDINGLFEISVPIGEHIIEIKQDGHTFSDGRYPSSGTFDFQAPKPGIEFTDSTFMTVVGRVVGGNREANKTPGLGHTKNNIGQAKVTFESKLGSGCYIDSIFTNEETGEYSINLPPLEFSQSVEVKSSFEALSFPNSSNELDVKSNKELTIVYDSTYNSLDSSYTIIDSFKFHYQNDFIHYNKPQIYVYGSDGISDFVGDTTYTYTNESIGYDTTINLIDNPLRWPVFTSSNNYEYTGIIRVFEEYINSDNTEEIRDSVPTTDGILSIVSEFTADIAGNLEINDSMRPVSNAVEMSKVNTVDTLKSLVFTIPVTGTPNFLENTTIPEYSYTKKLEIMVERPDGEVISWLPVTNPITNKAESFRGYLLGYIAEGQQFTTDGPQAVDFILRDPPGSGSSAKRGIGSSTSSKKSWSYAESKSGETNTSILMGAKFSAGFGVQVETEISNNFTTGVKSELSYNKSGSVSSKTTSTSEWATNTSKDLPGANSDLFIGKSQNVQFGINRSLVIYPDTACFTQSCYGNSFNGFQFGEKHELSVSEEGYETYFIYDQNHIKNYLIPNLVNKRNAILQSDSRYVSHLNVNDPNYGKNNDDTLLVTVSTNTPQLRELDNSDNSGLSYTYTPVTAEDSLKDQVWTDNHQIYLWEKALWENEWEKVNIDNQSVLDSLQIIELAELENEYKHIIERYEALEIAENVSIVANQVSSHIIGPFGVFPGAATFAVTNGVGIEISDISNKYNQYILKKERIIDNFNREKINYSVSSGSSFTSSMSHERVISKTETYNYDISLALGYEITVKVNGSGSESKLRTALNFKRNRSEESENSTTETTSYTLSDGDEGDFFSVDVFPSLLGYGPIFKLKDGGQTSCPHEDSVVTEYYIPGTRLSGRTQQRDRPVVSINPSLVQNVPMDGSAVFNLSLGNTSESNDDREYKYQLVTNSNPHGAIVKIDGLSPQGTVAINANSSLNKTITVQKGAGPVFEYDSLLFIIASPCQYESGTGANDDIADSVYFSAHFIPGCTEVSLIQPDNQWVLNNSFNDVLPVIIGDYDINFSGLEKFRVDYKPSNQANWIGLETFYKDTTGLEVDNPKPIPTSSHFTFYDWEVEQLTDGNYDLRVISLCEQADDGSQIYSGVIDRVNPHAFGNPSPADGILNPDDDILITFNEDIEMGSLTHNNFDIRGVLNGAPTRHDVSVEFNGVSSHIEIPSGLNLQSRDFTIEFWAKNASSDNMVYFSQGPGELEGLEIGVQSDDKLYFEIAGERVTTNNSISNLDKWHHYAFSYNVENEAVNIIVDGNIENTSNSNIYSNYIGAGKIFIGQSTFNSLGHFQGKIHDLRIWNHTRSVSNIVSHMTVQVGKQDLGLLNHWKMDEANGEMVTDHIRLRNGLLNDITWSLEPGGFSYSFNALDTTPYLLSASNIAFTSEKDFTLEFWSKSTSNNRETLFSNGKGDGLGADSLTSWCITKYTDGSLHLLHYGQDILIADTGSLDGNWHHTALVVDRSSSVSTFFDGKLISSTPVTPFKEFGSIQFALGARYYQNFYDKEYDEYFTGNIDEFRIWNLARSEKQINRDMRFKLSGDEIGLVSYVPFEKYEKDLGVFILKENYKDQVDSKHIATYQDSSLTNITPNIKLPRPVEKVNFTYSVNGDKIILTPSNPKADIENVTLDITVKDVLDLHGNVLQSPITWIAYPDQNQVGWETDLVNIDILKDQGYSFSKKIVNSGGSAKNFTIENIPSWLSTSVTEGVVDPGNTFEIDFTIQNNVNIGEYKEDIVVLTDFGYPESLTIDLKVRGEEPNWNVNPEDFINSMSIVASIAINDVVSNDDEDIIYAFVNGECRGKASLQYISSTDKYMAFLDVFSDSVSVENLEFRIWDASSGAKYVDVTPNNIAFAADGLIGSLLSPEQFNAYSKVYEEYVLDKGWNWISFHLATPDTTNLSNLLSSLDLNGSEQIKTLGNNTFATYSETVGWIGNVAYTGVSLDKGYKLKLSKADTLIVLGDVVKPTEFNIHLQPGWNWIGFVSIRPLNTSVALGNLSPKPGDLLKGRSNFSLYDEQLGWLGSLNTMYPGQAYMYKSLNDTIESFTYPLAGGFKMMTNPSFSVLEDSRWPIEYGNSISNMSAVVELEQCESSINLDDWYLGFFDGTGACRALSSLKMVNNDKQIAFVTAVGNDQLDLKPKLLNKATGEAIELIGVLSYETNKHIGSYESPLSVSLSSKDCAKFVNPSVTEEIVLEGNISVYPNIFSHSIFVDYSSLNNDILTIELINALGQKVLQFEEKVFIGDNRLELNQDLNDLPKGGYILRINDSQNSNHFKLIKN